MCIGITISRVLTVGYFLISIEEKASVGAFSVIVKSSRNLWEPLFEALLATGHLIWRLCPVSGRAGRLINEASVPVPGGVAGQLDPPWSPPLPTDKQGNTRIY